MYVLLASLLKGDVIMVTKFSPTDANELRITIHCCKKEMVEGPKVAVAKTSPKTIYYDIAGVLDLTGYDKNVSKDVVTTIKSIFKSW